MATRNEKDLLTRWPVEKGTEFGTTKTHTTRMFLIPEKKSLIRARDKRGL